jgi:CRP-like cAMP-binding protein
MAALVGNALLDALSQRERRDVLALSTLVSFEAGEVFMPKGRALPYVYFPVDCAAAIIERLEGRRQGESASIGREGMFGGRALLGLAYMSTDALCVVSGTAYRLPVDDFRTIGQETTRLHRYALRYLGALPVVVGQYSGCNRFHSPAQRIARWLLLAHDRMVRDSLEVTHEFLANLIGAHRPAVTRSLHDLRSCAAIDYTRRRVTILDRRELERASCECYRKIADGFKRLYR